MFAVDDNLRMLSIDTLLDIFVEHGQSEDERHENEDHEGYEEEFEEEEKGKIGSLDEKLDHALRDVARKYDTEPLEEAEDENDTSPQRGESRKSKMTDAEKADFGSFEKARKEEEKKKKEDKKKAEEEEIEEALGSDTGPKSKQESPIKLQNEIKEEITESPTKTVAQEDPQKSDRSHKTQDKQPEKELEKKEIEEKALEEEKENGLKLKDVVSDEFKDFEEALRNKKKDSKDESVRNETEETDEKKGSARQKKHEEVKKRKIILVYI